MTTFSNILHTLYPTNLTFHFYLKSEKLPHVYKFYKEVVNMVNLKTKTGINGFESKRLMQNTSPLLFWNLLCTYLVRGIGFSSAIISIQLLKTYIPFQIWVQFSSLFAIINKRLLWNPWLPTAMENNIANLFAAVSESVKAQAEPRP